MDGLTIPRSLVCCGGWVLDEHRSDCAPLRCCPAGGCRSAIWRGWVETDACVIGQGPFDTAKIWHETWQPKLVGRRGITIRVISGIDIALWDIKGKFANRSVHKLLGGYADKVPSYVAGGYLKRAWIWRSRPRK